MEGDIGTAYILPLNGNVLPSLIPPLIHPSYQRKQTGATCHISCWDFAGQEEFYSTHQCFLTCRSLYVVGLEFKVQSSAYQALSLYRGYDVIVQKKAVFGIPCF